MAITTEKGFVMQILPSTAAHAGFSTASPLRAGMQLSAGLESDTASATVSISAAARQAAASDVVENHRLPGWMASLQPGNTVNLDGLVGETRAAGVLLGKLTADGVYDAGDRARMRAYLDGSSPLHAAWQADRESRAGQRSEIAEYSGYLDAAWSSSLREQGIESRDDYVARVLNAPGDNTALHDSVVGKLLANPRAAQLMDILGIRKPESG